MFITTFFVGSDRYDTETRYCAVKEMGLDAPISMSYVPAEDKSKDEGFVIGWVAYKVDTCKWLLYHGGEYANLIG